jgi:D-alanyl-D-alanine carboxypeptidase
MLSVDIDGAKQNASVSLLQFVLVTAITELASPMLLSITARSIRRFIEAIVHARAKHFQLTSPGGIMVGMYKEPRSHRFVSYLLWGVLTAASIGTYYIVDSLNQSSREYDQAQTELKKSAYSGSVDVVQLPGSDQKLNIPSWSLFQTGNVWTLVSKAKPIDTNYTPNDLVDVPLPHGDSTDPMKVSSKIAEPLKKLAAAAQADGHTLAISSAYRSAKEQQAILDHAVQIQGTISAHQYVANPGSSEHQSGLAVDFSDDTPSCELDSDTCSLGAGSTQWLEDNAYKFGFIQRYPAGKESVTGIATERWHYRYVGTARVMHDSNMTFDEFVQLAR